MITVEIVDEGAFLIGIVHIEVELTAMTTDEFRKQIALLTGKGVHHFIIDFKHVDFIDSSGLGSIISITKRVQDLRGAVTLVAVQDSAKKVFKITHADHFLPMHDSVDEALKNLHSSLPLDPHLREMNEEEKDSSERIVKRRNPFHNLFSMKK